MRSRPVLAYTLLFFLSGATGLVYELLWVRVLYQSFGATIQSVTTVVAAYMGGLGLGAWLIGKRADRHPRPAVLYGRLEILIGLFGLASPFVLALAHQVYLALARGLPPGSGGSVALRFGLAGLVLLVPTTLMGGTLPVLTRAFAAARRDRLRASLGRLYGINTLGAVAGTALAGFFLIEHVGIRLSLLGTALVNMAIGLVATRLPAPETAAAGADAPASAPTPAALASTAATLLGITAFASLVDEIAWTRVLVMVVGGSTYAFTLILACFLLGIGVGSALVARRGRAPTLTAATAALAQGVTAAGAAVLLVFLTALPAYVLWVFHIPGLNAGPRLALMGGAVAAVVLLPAVGMGMTFPLLTDLVAMPAETRGGDVGRAYLLNTLGSIAGAVCAGFMLVAWIGTDRTLRGAVAVDALAALVLAALAARGVPERSADHGRLRPRVLGAGILAMGGFVAVFAAPQWTARLLDLGPTIYGRAPMSPAQRQAFLHHAGARPLAFVEGRNTTVSVWEGPTGRTLRVTGKVDASDYGDMDTQIMLGLTPVAAHPHPHSALAIGFGSGVTTSVLAAVSGMERVRVVELEPAILTFGSLFRAVNHDVLRRPNVRAIADDARSALQLAPDRFDVIVSEPSNPWVAGVATLYTPEFFRIVRDRLDRDGVFCQWIQLYQLPLPVLAGIVRNVRQVFPHTQMWVAGDYDLLVLGSAHPIRPDTAWVERLLGPGGALAAAGRDYLLLHRPADFYDRQVMGDAGVARLTARAGLTHTDDRPQLEFVAARRFLDAGYTGSILDSLADIERPVEAEDHLSPRRLARALSTLLGAPAGKRFLLDARAADPADPAWGLALAAIGVAQGDTSLADSILPGIVARARDPRAPLLAGLIATARRQSDPARALLERSLTAGADSAAAYAALARLDADDTAWAAASQDLRRSLHAVHNTFRSPFPRDQFWPVLRALVLHGPPPAVDSLLAQVVAVRPGWAALYEMRALVAVRGGACGVAADRLSMLEEFGLQLADGPALLAGCRSGRQVGVRAEGSRPAPAGSPRPPRWRDRRRATAPAPVASRW